MTRIVRSVIRCFRSARLSSIALIVAGAVFATLKRTGMTLLSHFLGTMRRFAGRAPAFCIALLTLCSFIITVRAQDESSAQRGFHPGSSYALSDIETISMSGGNLMQNIPLASLPAGRGGSPGFTLALAYNSKLYDSQIDIVPNPQGVEEARTHLGPSIEGGWRYTLPRGYAMRLVSRPLGERPPCNATVGDLYKKHMYIWKMEVVYPDGSVRVFRPLGYDEYFEDGYFNISANGWASLVSFTPPSCAYSENQSTTGPMTYYSADGSYTKLVVEHVEGSDRTGRFNPWTLFFPDGTRVVSIPGQPQRIYDRNNNFLETQSITHNDHPATKITDQLGRSIIIETDSQPGGLPGSQIRRDYIYAQGFGGEQLKWTVKWKQIYINKEYFATALDPSGGRGNSYRTSFTHIDMVVDQIILPTQAGGLTYTFGYNAGDYVGSTEVLSYGWGELSSVTLPSGARALYSYALDGVAATNSTYKWSNVLNSKPTQKTLIYRAEYDGVEISNMPCDPQSESCITEMWTYGLGGGGVLATMNSHITSVSNPDGGVTTELFLEGENEPFAGRSIRTTRPDGVKIERMWAQNRVTGMTARSVNPYVKAEFISFKDAAGNYVKTAIKDYSYDQNGNVTAVREYDWVDPSSIQRNGLGMPTAVPAGAQLKRVKTNTYYNPTPDASDPTVSPNGYYHANSPGLLRAIKSSEVSDGVTTLSRTESYYDDPGARGNLTELKSWDSRKDGVDSPLTRPLTEDNSISVAHQYDAHFNRTLSTDARGVQTQFIYGSVGDFTDLYPTETKVALGTVTQRVTRNEYDFHTGLVTRATDVDNNVSSSTTYDALGRPTLLKVAEGTTVETRTATEYKDLQRFVVFRGDLSAIGDGKRVSIKHYDQLGRLRLMRALEDSATQNRYDEADGIKTQTRYLFSGNNSYQLVSNPYRASTPSQATDESSMGWKRTKMDNGGRILEVETFSGVDLPAPFGDNESSTGVVVTGYDANITIVEDQAGKKRQRETDPFGNLIRVTEDPGGLNCATNYFYDALNKLRQVKQGSQTRTFAYDSMSRLISATNPESGTMTYSYDPNGNIIGKTDARGVMTTITYDALNRPESKVYAGSTPGGRAAADLTFPVKYFYDDYSKLPIGAPTWPGTPSKGMLIGVTYGTGSDGTYYKYDALSRIVTNHQRMGTSNYSTAYFFNRAGAVTREERGSSVRRRNEMSYDAAGRLSRMKTGHFSGGSIPLIDLVSGISYTPFGALQSETYNNGLIHSMGYNSRLQPTETRLGRAGNLESVFTIYNIFGTAQNANDQDTEINLAQNNGNIARIKYSVSGTIQYAQTFQYDPLNRLSYAVEHNNGVHNDGSRAWYQTFDYDCQGNRGMNVANTSDNADDANRALQLFEFSGTNNRTTRAGFVYDDSGNLIAEPGKTFAYDAENRIVAATTPGGGTSQYIYNGIGLRVKKIVGGVATRFEYGADGKLITERSDNSVVIKDYLYRSGELIATTKIGANGQYEYATADHLGTPRAWTDDSGNLVVGGRHDYRPFGEELFAGVGLRSTAQGYASNTQQDGQRKQFTGYERDPELELDFAQARYFSSLRGRFTSPDPYNPIVDTEDKDEFNEYLGQPQNWNRYAYVWNNPLRYKDPSGERVFIIAYTVGNELGGDEEFRVAAETLAAEIRNSKGFDPKKDRILIYAVRIKDNFKFAAEEANSMEKQFGKVELLALFSHSGPVHGPSFDGATPEARQFKNILQELTGLKINWSATATAKFYGCNTAVNFAQNFANIQNVPTYGFDTFSSVSSSPTEKSKKYWFNPWYDGPLYYIGRDGRPMVRRDPKPKDEPKKKK
jgi:RHS repeat-associated protein